MNEPNTLTLGTEDLDEDIAALQPGEACYVRARVTCESADRGCRHFTVDEVSHDGEASADGPEASGEEEGKSDAYADNDEMPMAGEKGGGITLVMKGHK